MSRFSKWLEKKAHEIRVKRIFKKYGPSPELGGNWFLMTEERQRKAFLDAYIDTGDIRCLIDYFELRNPQDYRYFEKAFREALATSVFRQYDNVRYMLIEFWYDILCLEKQNEYQDIMIKKYFGKIVEADVGKKVEMSEFQKKLLLAHCVYSFCRVKMWHFTPD